MNFFVVFFVLTQRVFPNIYIYIYITSVTHLLPRPPRARPAQVLSRSVDGRWGEKEHHRSSSSSSSTTTTTSTNHNDDINNDDNDEHNNDDNEHNYTTTTTTKNNNDNDNNERRSTAHTVTRTSGN